MKSKVCVLFAAFWMCCAVQTDLAAQTEFISRQYTMKDGLPSDGVNCVMQDSRGFIWMGTFSGLCRFEKMCISLLKI